MPIVQRTAYPKVITGTPLELQRIVNQTFDLINSQPARYYVINFSSSGNIAVGKLIAPPVEIDDQHLGVPIDARLLVNYNVVLHGPLSIDFTLNGAPMLRFPILLSAGIVRQVHDSTSFLHPEYQFQEGDQVGLSVNAVNASDVGVLLKAQLKVKLQGVKIAPPSVRSIL